MLFRLLSEDIFINLIDRIISEISWFHLLKADAIKTTFCHTFLVFAAVNSKGKTCFIIRKKCGSSETHKIHESSVEPSLSFVTEDPGLFLHTAIFCLTVWRSEVPWSYKIPAAE